MAEPRASAIILTALQKEYRAVRAHLDNIHEDTHKGTVYEVGTFSANGRSWDVAIVEVGRHIEKASFETERAIDHFNPRIAIFMGVAGSLKPDDATIGDVVAATKVYGYEAGKAKDKFQPTPEVYLPAHAMEQRARAVARNPDWLKRIKGSVRESAPKAVVDPIASGPKVVKSTKSATYKFIRSQYSDAVAVDMEGLGFLAASHANPEVRALVIRGISDLIDDKEAADAGGSQEIASQNAAAFAFEILARLDLGEKGEPPLAENIPFKRNRNFTGRDDLLDRLRAALTSGQYSALTQAIAGLGGVGKTQLALEYSYRHMSSYKVIWWVRSEDPAILAGDYAGLAERLKLVQPGEASRDIEIEAVKRWLENNSGWLLVFDNAQDPGDLGGYLPRKGAGHVIITSRNPNWGNFADTLEVLEFKRPESIRFLANRTGQSEEKSADALADALGDLPLALEQAGAYIKASGISLIDYLELFQQKRRGLLEFGKPLEYPDTVLTTWNISVEAAKDETPESVDLLSLCSYLAPDQIPRSLFIREAEHLPEPLASAAKDELRLHNAIATLRRYSLITYAADAFSIHRMVQAVTMDRLSEDDQKRWAEAAAKLIDAAFPYDSDKVQTWLNCAILLPHALVAAEYAQKFGVASEATGHLLNQTGLYLLGIAEFEQAKKCFERALKIDEKVYGLDHPAVATDVDNLGMVLQDLGDLQGAKKYYDRALKICRNTLGEDHPNTKIIKNNLVILEAQK